MIARTHASVQLLISLYRKKTENSNSTWQFKT